MDIFYDLSTCIFKKKADTPILTLWWSSDKSSLCKRCCLLFYTLTIAPEHLMALTKAPEHLMALTIAPVHLLAPTIAPKKCFYLTPGHPKLPTSYPKILPFYHKLPLLTHELKLNVSWRTELIWHSQNDFLIIWTTPCLLVAI